MSNNVHVNTENMGDLVAGDKVAGNQQIAARNIYNITIQYAPQPGSAHKERSEAELEALWRAATEKYTEQLFNEYGHVKILGQSQPKPLLEIFTDVHIHTHRAAWLWFSTDELERQFVRHGRFGNQNNLARINALEIMQLNSRLFLWGKPGAGKTTLLKYLAIQTAQQKSPVIPIFVRLRRLANTERNLLQFIGDLFKRAGFPEPITFAQKLLRSGQALVMLDGLDEVTRERDKRGQIGDEIQDFVNQFYQSRYIISSRTAATNSTFENFSDIEMADFSDEQTTLFVKRWFREEPETAAMFLKEIAKAENRGIRELAQSPLLLTLLCLQFDASLSFPMERSEIYESALRVLLEKWDASRRIGSRTHDLQTHGKHYRALTTRRKEQLMSHLAAGAFDESKIFLSQKWLEEQIVRFLVTVPPRPNRDEIDGGLVLKAMESQHGLLIERARHIYSFSHLTFQEYFAARYVVDHANQGTIERLITIENILNPRRHEIFKLTAGLLPNGDSFFDHFIVQLQLLAGQDEAIRNFVDWADQRSRALSTSEQKLIDLRFRHIGLARDFVRAVEVVRILIFGKAEGRQAYFELDLKEAIEIATKESEDLEWREMVVALENLDFPAENSSPQTWHNLHTDLLSLLDELVFRGRRWEFNQTQLDLLINWLNGHSLLFACLDRAIVSDRTAIEAQLFLARAQ